MANPNMRKGMPSVNPKGRSPGVFHTLSDKRSHFLTTLSRSDILRIAASDEELDKYTAFESQVLIGLAESLMVTPEDKLDPSRAREHIYDREMGKPTNKTELTGKGGEAIEYKAVGSLVDTLPSNVRQKLLAALDDAVEE